MGGASKRKIGWLEVGGTYLPLRLRPQKGVCRSGELVVEETHGVLGRWLLLLCGVEGEGFCRETCEHRGQRRAKSKKGMESLCGTDPSVTC